ncbi:MAG TPA: DUF4936 family protein [Burkholderiales bacterium]|nr:DUF4936 family protein [Burkholderiales bacterium]
MALCYYIYYRVTQPQRAGIVVRSMQSQLLARCGVHGRLLTKRDEPKLWMEVYEGVNDAPVFEAELDRLIGEMNVEVFLEPGSRRCTECFKEPCA